MRIVFMGTPDFAVPSLDILVQNGYEVVAVITATDKLGGRGNKKVLVSAVKKYAVANNIPVLQPKNLKNEAFQNELRAYKADLQIVVAFRMLPVAVWDMPSLGTFNLHGSLLPKYRGAAPINWAVMNGDTKTGVTTFFLKHEIDTGSIIFQDEFPIGPNDSVGLVHDKMMGVGANLVLKTVKAIETKTYELQTQNEEAVSHAPKIFHENCGIDFSRKAEEIHNFIRGLSPYPTAWTLFKEQKLKVFESRLEKAVHAIPSGKWITDNKTYLKVAVKGGFIAFEDLQLAGRKRMKIKDFLNGFKIDSFD